MSFRNVDDRHCKAKGSLVHLFIHTMHHKILYAHCVETLSGEGGGGNCLLVFGFRKA